MLNVDTIRESEKISHEKIYSEKQLYEQGSWLAKPVKTVMDSLELLSCKEINVLDLGCGVGRIIMFKECLKHNIIPFIIEDNLKFFYYRGLKEWDNEKGYLMDTCLTAQDRYKAYLDYFEIKYEKN